MWRRRVLADIAGRVKIDRWEQSAGEVNPGRNAVSTQRDSGFLDFRDLVTFPVLKRERSGKERPPESPFVI